MRTDPSLLVQLGTHLLREAEVRGAVTVQVADLLAVHPERELAAAAGPCLDAGPRRDLVRYLLTRCLRCRHACDGTTSSALEVKHPWLDQRMTEPGLPEEPPPLAADVIQRTSLAAERTWLAWWRTALAATVGALGVGRLAPELLDVASWPYVVLGAGYAALAVGLLITGAARQRELQHALDRGSPSPLSFGLVTVFTAGGVVLALTTIVLVLAQT